MSLPAILLITAAAALLAWPALRFAYYVLGPAVDNQLGILTRRDLDAFKRYEVDGKPLGSLIEERLGPCKWHARHGEFIFATDIDCRPLAGGIARWEINRVAPREWLPAQPLYVTPLDATAVATVPELAPKGVLPSAIPPGGYRSGVIHEISSLGRARRLG